jgi:OCT family organic cation transporter-like MFS transporter 13
MKTENEIGYGTNEQVRIEMKDFDDILSYIGGWGTFQYVLTIMFFPFNIFLGYIYLSPILVLFTPPHWCLVPELANLTREERMQLAIPQDMEIAGGFSQCSQYVVDWEKVRQMLKSTETCNWGKKVST